MRPRRAARAGQSAADVDVYDFEAMAHRVLPPAHWGYMATGTDGEERSGRTHEASTDISCGARRFVDVSRIDMGTAPSGTRSPRPSSCVPWAVSGRSMLTASWPRRAAQARGQLQILSTQSSTDRGRRRREAAADQYQLYTTSNGTSP